MAVIKIKVLKFEIGDFVVYRNHSRKFRSRAVRQCFTKLTREQIRKLRKGIIIWTKDQEYIGLHGAEVEGFNCEKIKKIKVTEPQRVVFFRKGYPSSNSYCCNFIPAFYQADMKRLLSLIGKYPEALNLRFEK